MRRSAAIIYRLPLSFLAILVLNFLYTSPAFTASELDFQKEINEVSSFQVQPGDRLDVLVYREDDLSGVYEVDPAGRINYPLIGEIQAAGLEIEKFREALTVRLKEYLLNPQVSISRAEGNIKSISVLGRVSSPGIYDYIPGSTLMRLISTAGGFADSASKKKIRIIRMVNGAKQVMEVNASDIIKEGKKDPDIKPGDIIFVPESIF